MRLGRYSRYEEGKKVVHDVGRGDARDISVIVSGCDFDDVCADKVEACQAADDALNFTRRPATRLGSPGSRCQAWVNNVDIEVA